MKKRFFIILGVSMLALIAAFTYLLYATKKYSPADIAIYRHKGAEITVTYSRPYKKGRLIFGDESSGALQPYGKYWRMGANEATVFVTNKDLMINGQHLHAGHYSMHAYPGKESWEIVLNSDAKRWGGKAPDTSKNVLATRVIANNKVPLTEQFTILFSPADSSNTNMILRWDETEVVVPVIVH
jgi:hypothetical protein